MVLVGRKGESHFTIAAVAIDFEEGIAGFHEDVAGQTVSILAFKAGAELSADAVAGVHEWGGIGRWRACFEGRGDLGHAVIKVELFCQTISDVIGRGEDGNGAACGQILWAAFCHRTGNAMGAVE